MPCFKGGGKPPQNHPFGTFGAPPTHAQDPSDLNYLCRYEEGSRYNNRSTWPEYYANKRIAENAQKEKEADIQADIHHIQRMHWEENGMGGGGPKALKVSNNVMKKEVELIQRTSMKLRRESLRLMLTNEYEDFVKELALKGLAIKRSF